MKKKGHGSTTPSTAVLSHSIRLLSRLVVRILLSSSLFHRFPLLPCAKSPVSLYCISLSLSPFPRPLARSLEDAQAHPSSGLHHAIIKFSKLNRVFLLIVPSSSPQKCPESSQPCPVPHRRPELRPSLPPRPGWWTCHRTPGRRARRETA